MNPKNSSTSIRGTSVTKTNY